MAKEAENSLEHFTGKEYSVAAKAVFGALLVAVFTGFAVSALNANWTYTFLFAAVAAFVGMLFYLRMKQMHLSSAAAENGLDWQPSAADVQRQDLNLEVTELARILEIEPEQNGDLQSAYIVAEDLALRQIQQEERTPMMRHVSIHKVPFDAVFIKGNVCVCVELSFLVAPDIRQEKIDAVMRRVALVSNEFERSGTNMAVRLMLVLVTQLTPEDDRALRSVLNKSRFPSTPVDIDIRFLDFEALQRMYVTDAEPQP